LGLAYYDYRNISGIRNPSLNDVQFNGTATNIRQKGNTLFNIDNDGNPNTNLYALAADYQLVNLTGMVDLNVFNPVHLMLGGDYVKNVGFSRSKTLERTGMDIDPQTAGYMARVAVGMPTMLLKNDWQVSIAYRYLEADAVLDAFSDSDFHLGGTNSKGFILGAQYGLGKNTWLSARWLSSNEIRGLPLSTDVFQLYFNAKF
ncbi:putative porin, partial [Rhodoferax sp.]|uniref:putative porin n=1 Tax=Rhodoferax sp. TaxID=50421 RepID=UPI00271F0839